MAGGRARVKLDAGAAESVLADLPHAVLTLDATGRIQFANRAAGTLLRRAASPLRGQPLVDWIEIEYRPAFERALDRVYAGVPVSGLECPLAARGLQDVWVEWEGTAHAGGALLIGRDVRMRRVLRNALASQQEELRETLASVLDSVPVGIVIADAAGGPRLVNRAARDLLGIYALAPVAHWCRSGLLRRPDGTPAGVEDVPVLRTLADGRPLRDIELHVVRPWGEAVPVLLNTDAVHDENGRILEVCCTFTDIRERRRIEHRLHQSQKLEAVGTLAGGIAHDFSNILCAIRGYGELALGQAAGDERTSRLLGELLKATDRASTLTRQLLSFSRGDALAPRRLDLAGVVVDMDSMLRRLLGREIGLEVAPTEGSCPILADPGQMEQVLLNLILNARDATAAGGVVHVSTARLAVPGPKAPAALDLPAGEYVRLTVADAGCGMDARTLGKIFEPFFTTKEQGKGTGLGLSTVYGIVKQNRGRIHVESQLDVGTTFRVYLPVAAAPAAGAEIQPQPPSHPPRRARILLAEDEDLVRALLRKILEEEGHEVIEAPNGRAALEAVAAQTEPVDLLVTDVMMPRMGGRELAQTLRERDPSLRVLFVSGHADDALARGARAETGTLFLPKPFDARTLASRVRALLGIQDEA
ncbi:MAG: response regulator [Planctomycetota bacterium]|nr:response regulator [Planctomycetota bacterium]